MMIALGSYYFIDAEQVETVEVTETKSTANPYTLTVHTKNGRSYGVCYKDKRQRDKARDDFVAKVNKNRRHDSNFEQIYNKIYLMEDCVKRVDKRQLRIWRLLRDVLNGKAALESEVEPNDLYGQN